MRALSALTIANIRGFVRDRAALFWTLAFPLIFIFLFGFIFQGSGGAGLDVAWADEDGSPASAQLRTAFAATEGVDVTDHDRAAAIASMQDGEVDTVIVVPAGYGAGLAAAGSGTGAPAQIEVYTDPSRQQLQGSVYQVVGSVLGVVNLGGRPPMVVPIPQTVQTENLNFISYFVPSILALSVMQVGIFAAVPLVADREKGILKRLSATPLRRWQLVGSNTLMRLLIALVQTVIIVGVGVAVLRRRGQRLAPAGGGVRGAGRRGVPRPRLRPGVVHQDRGGRQRHHAGRPVPDDVPVGRLLPDRGDAAVPPVDRPADPVDLPGRCAAPGHGRWNAHSRRCAVCAAVLLGWLVVCFAIASRKFQWQ